MSTTIKEDLQMILERLDRLERLIGNQNDPFEYPETRLPDYVKYPANPFPHDINSTAYSKCELCGFEFNGTNGYYCLLSKCPTFLKAT